MAVATQTVRAIAFDGTMGASPAAPAARRSIFALVNEWADWLGARGTSERTVDQYWRYVLAAGFRADKDPREFTERDVVRVATSYPAQGGGGAMSIRAMRSFFTWAEDSELLVNPARRITVPRSKLGPAPRLSREELEAVWKAAESVDPRARPTLVLLYHTGARVGSMCGVAPEHIRFDRSGQPSIYFVVAKGNYPYELPVESPEAVDALIELVDLYRWKPKMAVSRRDSLVGVGEATVWKWASRAGTAAGVRTYPHLLRHTMLSDMAEDPEVDQRTLIEAANWRDGSQIRRYAAPSEPRIRGAFARLGKVPTPRLGSLP